MQANVNPRTRFIGIMIQYNITVTLLLNGAVAQIPLVLIIVLIPRKLIIEVRIILMFQTLVHSHFLTRQSMLVGWIARALYPHKLCLN